MADEQVDAVEMIRIWGGTFLMGSDAFYPEESPRRSVCVDAFLIDATPVTNLQFATFVDATGYRTLAESAPDPADYPWMDASLAQPGSLVFTKTKGPVDMADATQWWQLVNGADWKHPCGPDTNLSGLDDDPVVHVTIQDAQAYAQWAGKDLPTEAEWE